MMISLGNSSPLGDAELSTINHPVRIGVGDRDTTISVEESCEIYRQLPNAEFEVLPGAAHPLEKVDIVRLAASLDRFFG